jgi:hypothetical protein
MRAPDQPDLCVAIRRDHKRRGRAYRRLRALGDGVMPVAGREVAGGLPSRGAGVAGMAEVPVLALRHRHRGATRTSSHWMNERCSTSPAASGDSPSTGCTADGGDEWSCRTARPPCAVPPTAMSPGCAASGPDLLTPGVRVTSHASLRCRDELPDGHASDHVDLVFSNAGRRRRLQHHQRLPAGAGAHVPPSTGGASVRRHGGG